MSCTGNCNQGHSCTCVVSQTEMANAVPPDDKRTFDGALRRGQVIPIRPAVAGGPIPRLRRVGRWLRDFWDFVCSPRFLP